VWGFGMAAKCKCVEDYDRKKKKKKKYHHGVETLEIDRRVDHRHKRIARIKIG